MSFSIHRTDRWVMLKNLTRVTQSAASGLSSRSRSEGDLPRTYLRQYFNPACINYAPVIPKRNIAYEKKTKRWSTTAVASPPVEQYHDRSITNLTTAAVTKFVYTLLSLIPHRAG